MTCLFCFFQAEDDIRDYKVTGVQTCALPISDLGIRNYIADIYNQLHRFCGRVVFVNSRVTHTLGQVEMIADAKVIAPIRSEERRVGKEWKTRWWQWKRMRNIYTKHAE